MDTLSSNRAATGELLVEKVLSYIRPGGCISQHLKGFEPREQQQMMMQDIISAYNQNQIALIEAGTGTGKSMAYLIPAILWAAKFKERTVISTHTITLQEQLVAKDIPLLIKALGLDLKAVLVKGMGNYVCLRKYNDTLAGLHGFQEKELREFHALENWLPTSKDGSRADLPFVPSQNLWEQVGAEPDTCTWRRCPFFQECHFVKARQQAADAQLLVVNHHLLFADLTKRAEDDNYTDSAVLPAYEHVIIDEAHNIEDVATEYFATRLSRHETARMMARLASERTGKLVDLKKAVIDAYSKKRTQHPPAVTSILNQLDLDLPGQRRQLIQRLSDTFEAYESFVFNFSAATSENEQDHGPGERKMRLFPSHFELPHWKEVITPTVEALSREIRQFVATIHVLFKQIENLDNEDLWGKILGLRHDITALTNRLHEYGNILSDMAKTRCIDGRVRWIETHPHRNYPNVHLIDAALDVSDKLKQYLFDKFKSVVLCSATMTVNNSFGFLRQRLGLDGEVQESTYDSPFAYEKQVLLAVPSDMPEPSHPSFNSAVTEKVWEIINTSRGNALVLFTSYQALNTCFNALQERFSAGRFIGLRQGDDSRYQLLERFRHTDRSVLFATHSFWEGVDISGEALRCVIIVKLPFKVPTEPLIQARTEAINAAGGDAFRHYALPLAIVKFKQGFGRLIRHKRDRGCIICLDPRLITKNYGTLFLNSLPACQRVFAPTAEVLTAMKEFFRRTHHLTKSSS